MRRWRRASGSTRRSSRTRGQRPELINDDSSTPAIKAAGGQSATLFLMAPSRRKSADQCTAIG
jgi:hypothetical protein